MKLNKNKQKKRKLRRKRAVAKKLGKKRFYTQEKKMKFLLMFKTPQKVFPANCYTCQFYYNADHVPQHRKYKYSKGMWCFAYDTTMHEAAAIGSCRSYLKKNEELLL